MPETMTPPALLPPAEIKQLRLGFMRLTDSAPLVMAQEMGLFQQYGLEVTLVREVSWANLRDRLTVGNLDAAQLLAPLPVATMLGAGGIQNHLLTGLALGFNGNAITLSNALCIELGVQTPPGQLPDPEFAAHAIARRARTGAPALTIATVHAFSMHTFLLREWLRRAGGDPDQLIRLLVLPPEQMCDSLARGIIDGFCAGEPWGSMAVMQGIGTVTCAGCQLWHQAPEKVLGVTAYWHELHPNTHLRLRLAVMRACKILSEISGRAQAAQVLSRAEYLDIPVNALRPSLTGRYIFSRGTPPVDVPDFHVFWQGHATFPWQSQGDWIVRRTCELLGRTLDEAQSHDLIERIWRTDLYCEAAHHLGEPVPDREIGLRD